MQKLIHITDTHFLPPDKRLYGLDPAERLRQTFDHIAKAHPDAKAVVITGDLADCGESAAYQFLLDTLDEVNLPVYVTLGNHDNRHNFRTVFGGEGFVQTSVDLDDWRIILLDTLDDQSGFGSLDDGRLEWLEAQLSACNERPVLLALHHTPGDLHIPCFAWNDLKEADRFLDIIVQAGNVRHMLFGHRHVAISGSMARIPFTSNQGTAQHISLDWSQPARQNLVAATPVYDVVCLTSKSVIVHHETGLDRLPIIRPGDPK